eukprot:gene17347-19079_t
MPQQQSSSTQQHIGKNWFKDDKSQLEKQEKYLSRSMVMHQSLLRTEQANLDNAMRRSLPSEVSTRNICKRKRACKKNGLQLHQQRSNAEEDQTTAVPSLLSNKKIVHIAKSLKASSFNKFHSVVPSPEHLPCIPKVGHRETIACGNRFKVWTKTCDDSDSANTVVQQNKYTVLMQYPCHKMHGGINRGIAVQGGNFRVNELRFNVDIRDKTVFKHCNRNSSSGRTRKTVTSPVDGSEDGGNEECTVSVCQVPCAVVQRESGTIGKEKCADCSDEGRQFNSECWGQEEQKINVENEEKVDEEQRNRFQEVIANLESEVEIEPESTKL